MLIFKDSEVVLGGSKTLPYICIGSSLSLSMFLSFLFEFLPYFFTWFLSFLCLGFHLIVACVSSSVFLEFGPCSFLSIMTFLPFLYPGSCHIFVCISSLSLPMFPSPPCLNLIHVLICVSSFSLPGFHLYYCLRFIWTYIQIIPY